MPSTSAISRPPSQTVTPTAAAKPGLTLATFRLDRAGKDICQLVAGERLSNHVLRSDKSTGLDWIDLREARRVDQGKVRSYRDETLGHLSTPAVRQVDVHQNSVDIPFESVDHLGGFRRRRRPDHVEAARAQEMM